jgi:hypothetical protein
MNLHSGIGPCILVKCERAGSFWRCSFVLYIVQGRSVRKPDKMEHRLDALRYLSTRHYEWGGAREGEANKAEKDGGILDVLDSDKGGCCPP